MTRLYAARWRGWAAMALTVVFLAGPASVFAADEPVPSSADGDDLYAAPDLDLSVPTARAANGSLADRLHFWLRLVGPDQASVQDYADFLANGAAWPRRSLINARMEQALLTETDPAIVNEVCRTRPLVTAAALAYCVQQAPGLAARLADEAGRAWQNGNDAATPAHLLATQFPAAVTPAASWARFDREERAGLMEAARRTLPYLDADRQALARARLAFRTGEADAPQLAAALPASVSSDSFLVLDHARWLRQQQRYDEAVALWAAAGNAAEQAAPPALFWREREALARELLQARRATDALSVADDPMIGGTGRMDSRFLCGWIALRFGHDAARATEFFMPLTQSASLISKSRGLYWLARAYAQAGNDGEYHTTLKRAAEFPTTFYGQLAGALLEGQDQALLKPSYVADITRRGLRGIPSADEPVDEALDANELAQAAALLVSWGDRPHARDFLQMLATQTSGTTALRGLSALAQRLDLPDIAVTAARKAGRDGVLLRSGWPDPYSITGNSLPAGLVPGLIRQESSFNPDAVSTSNAIGLMQLKPSTAADMTRRAGLAPSAATVAGLHDPMNNIRLGVAYLEHIQQRFGPVVPYLAAAYNGGPGRLGRWLDAMGDPARDGAKDDVMLDWIESIPIAETRNYVQRVWGNMIIYRVVGER
jgi:soluble lytic murein transglycosylase